MEAFYSDVHGVLVIKPDDGHTPESNVVVHELPTFVEAWAALNEAGYDCSGFVRVDLGSELGEALQATDLQLADPQAAVGAS